MCDTHTCCELFHRYMDSIAQHLDMVERSIYPQILTGGNQNAMNQVNNFMNGSQELKRILKQYTRKWCKRQDKVLKIGNHQAFVDDSEHLFEVLYERLQDETENLYPLSRKIG